VLASSSISARFRYALKIASWPKLLVPVAFGQVLGALGAGRFDGCAALYAFAFAVFDLAFIVLLNDYGDREVDAIKRRMFPDGCSPKTIPDGILPAHALLFAGVAAGALSLGVSLLAAMRLDRPLLPAMAMGCLLVFVAYTLPPLRLNYRGGGELLEMLGVGVFLPLFSAYLQGGDPLPSLSVLLPGYALLSLSSAVASGLSDEQSDRRGGKRTVVTLVGNRLARRIVEGSRALGALAWVLPFLLPPPVMPFWVILPALSVMALAFRDMRRLSGSAVTGAFREQGLYKAALHRALWWGTLALASTLALAGALS
jgi:1,4-dihydroxy-2-naphthoate octaprenyltransferase/chlorophyll synthase